MHLRGKHPLKKNAEINVMLNAKINDYIYDEECEDIVRYMYNQDDAHKIIEKLNSQYIHSQKSQYQDRILTRQEKKQAVTDLEKPKVMYNKFEQIILEFQLLCHEIFLQNFNRGFKLVDQDNNGIINEEEFFNLINLFKLNTSQQQVESYLTKMDPYSQNHFTFSQVVLLFSQELINDGTKTTILQSISQQNN